MIFDSFAVISRRLGKTYAYWLSADVSRVEFLLNPKILYPTDIASFLVPLLLSAKKLIQDDLGDLMPYIVIFLESLSPIFLLVSPIPC